MSSSKAQELSPSPQEKDHSTTPSTDDQRDRDQQDHIRSDEVKNSDDPRERDAECNSSIVDEPSLTLSDGGEEDATPNTAAAILVGRAVERALGSPKRKSQIQTATPPVDKSDHYHYDNQYDDDKGHDDRGDGGLGERDRSVSTSFVSDPSHSLLSSPRLLSEEGAASSAPQNTRNLGDKAINLEQLQKESNLSVAVTNSVANQPRHHPQVGAGAKSDGQSDLHGKKQHSSEVGTRRTSVTGNSKVLSMLLPQHKTASTAKQQLKNSDSSVVREEKRKSGPSSKADVILERRSGRNKSEGGNSNASASAAAAATERQQNQILQKILTELKALKAALPTQNEVAMVFAQNTEDGTRLQSYCRGMVRRMQSLERKRKAMSELGSVEQKRQTIIQKARQRREEQHLAHVAEFLTKEALRVDKREERVEVLTDETAESRMRRQQLLKEAEAKRQEQEAQRAAKLEESVAKWKEHAERVAEEKEKEREKASAIRARRIHEEVVNNSDRGSSFLTLPHAIGHSQGSIPAVSSLSTSSGAAYRAALARAQQQQSNQTQSHSHSQSRLVDDEDDDTPVLTEDPEAKAMSATGRTSLSHSDNHHSSNAAGGAPPTLTREAFEQMQQQERLQREQALAHKMAAHLRRSELVRIHRRETAKKMTERGASIPAFKEKLLESQEEAYRCQLAKENEEKALLEQFQQGKQRIVLERIEKNRKRQEEAQRRVEQQKAAEEERLKALAEKKKLKEQQSMAKTAPSGGATDSSSARPNGLSTNGVSSHALPSPARSTGGGQASAASSPPRHYQQQQHQLQVEQQAAAARMSKLARKLLERTERVAALYSVEPVAASAPLQERTESPEKHRGGGQEADEGQQTASVRRTREDRKRDKEEAEQAAAEEAARERARRIEKFLSPTRQHVWERAPPDREKSEERNGKDSKSNQNTSSPHSKSPAANAKGGKTQNHAQKTMNPHRQQPMSEPSALAHTQGSAMDASAKRSTANNHKMQTNQLVEKQHYQCELCKDQCDTSCMCCNHHHSLSEGLLPETDNLPLPYDALALFFDPSFFAGSAFPALRMVGEVAGFGLEVSSSLEAQPVADGAAEVEKADLNSHTEASHTEGCENELGDTTNEGDLQSQNRHPYVAAMYLAAAAK